MAYKCKKLTEKIVIDGDLTKDVWQRREKSHRFIDVVGGTPTLHPRRSQQNYRSLQLDVELFLLQSVVAHDHLRQKGQGGAPPRSPSGFHPLGHGLAERGS